MAKGSVVFVGTNEMVCDEASAYTVTDKDGNDKGVTSLLANGDVVSDIPEEELGRWLLNLNFKPESQNAEDAKKAVEKQQEIYSRVNGSELSPLELEKQRAAEGRRASLGVAELPAEEQEEAEEEAEEAVQATLTPTRSTGRGRRGPTNGTTDPATEPETQESADESSDAGEEAN